MSGDDAKPEKCRPIEAPGIFPGWLCCLCHTYNGNQRDACKNGMCAHRRCDAEAGTGPVIDGAGNVTVRRRPS